MSKTGFMEYGDTFVWVLRDPFAVFCVYLREALGQSEHAEEPWVAERRSDLLSSISYSVLGQSFVPDDIQDGALRSAVHVARRKAIEGGDLRADDINTWTVEGTPVDGPTSVGVSVDSILDVADTLLAMLEGTLASPPPYERWVVGTDTPGATIGHSLP